MVVDCWEYRTKTVILSKILIEMGIPVPARKEGIEDDVEEYVSETLDLLTRIFAHGDDEIRGYALALLADGGNVANIDMMQRQLRRVRRA